VLNTACTSTPPVAGPVTGPVAGTDLQRFEYNAIVMAADTRVVLYAADEPTARAAATAAIDRMQQLDRVMSTYIHNSELNELLAGPAGSPQPISDDLLNVLLQALALARHSDGAFDITTGPLIQLWRDARDTGQLPTASQIQSARSRTGWHLLVLDRSARTATLTQPNMHIDLGGIGKGFAVDHAAAVLKQHGMRHYLVALAGDIAVGDPPPGKTAWMIALQNEASGESSRLPLANAAVSTSGDTFQHVVIDGVRYSHIVDPSTGLGLTDHHAVTVIGPCATTADGLATALSVLGPARSDGLLVHYPHVQVMFHAR